MDPALAIEKAALACNKPMDELIARGDSPVQQFYSGATVFVTGGSGFLGKQLIEKLFRSCRIKKLYILLRPKKGKIIKERLEEILNDPIFGSLHINQPDFKEKLVPIEGDVAALDLGINAQDKQLIIDEVDIMFHVAASIVFEAPLQFATLINVRGTREMIKLAKNCKKLKSFIHVSTAFSNATLDRAGSKIMEQFYPCPLDPELMIKMAEGIEKEKLNDMKQSLVNGWPNTYTFTKALAEELLRTNAGDLPVAIIRPTAVIGSIRGPCPGWVDQSIVFGAGGAVLGPLMGVIHCVYGRKDQKLDFVPVDYVCNAIITAAVAARENALNIYHIGSINRNFITKGKLIDIVKQSIVPTLISDKAMWCCFFIQTRRRWLYYVLKYVLHDTPAFLVDNICLLMGKPQRLRKIYSTIDKLDAVLKYYAMNYWIFDDNNTLKLYQSLSETDKRIYPHDTANIEWTEMICLWYIGMRKYVVKDGINRSQLGIKRQQIFKIITFIIFTLFPFSFVFIFKRLLYRRVLRIKV